MISSKVIFFAKAVIHAFELYRILVEPVHTRSAAYSAPLAVPKKLGAFCADVQCHCAQLVLLVHIQTASTVH